MIKLVYKLVLFLGVVAFSSQAIEGNIDSGQAKAQTCAACHGADGNSPVNLYPKIAGQHAEYIYKQLVEFKVGMTSNGKQGRYDPVMSGMAMALSEQDMKDIALYYSAQKINITEVPASIIEQGNSLYRAGNKEKSIPACIACHGPKGNGQGLAGFPAISGQHPAYTKSQLEKFRQGERANDLNGMMRDIAKKLSDEEIDTLSQYLQGLH